ncbi:protein Allo60 [Cyprinid herpesvirus 1]|uniref:Protein Allo60 n=1 Tax=Cyprinid herpesvirus 1 TaxID=317858 RepID=K7PC83_9VIRU|nr:protein Allo60 [Cyprinid herpesvirus 1]AFJ20377.1 protein Allo60 [Cyprinid herpesvirus 1]
MELPRVAIPAEARELGITKTLSELYPSHRFYRGQRRIAIKLEVEGDEQDLVVRLTKSLRGRVWTKPQLRAQILSLLPGLSGQQGEDACQAAAEALTRSAPFTLKSVRSALISTRFFARMGSLVDSRVKREFECGKGYLVDHLKAVYGWRPLASAVNVTSKVPLGHSCERCHSVCSRQVPSHKTELDAVAVDERGEYALLEIKTRSSSTVTAALLRRYQVQTWIGEMMFRNTYGMCTSKAIHSYIVFVDPCSYTVDRVICVDSKLNRPSPRLFALFPSLLNLCQAKLSAPRVLLRPPAGRPSRPCASGAAVKRKRPSGAAAAEKKRKA